jgi:hypothetical protein
MIQDLYNEYITMTVYTDEVSNCRDIFIKMDKLQNDIINNKDFEKFFPKSENIINLSDVLVQKYIDEYLLNISVQTLKDRLIWYVNNLYIFDRVLIEIVCYGWYYDLFKLMPIYTLL